VGYKDGGDAHSGPAEFVMLIPIYRTDRANPYP